MSKRPDLAGNGQRAECRYGLPFASWPGWSRRLWPAVCARGTSVGGPGGGGASPATGRRGRAGRTCAICWRGW